MRVRATTAVNPTPRLRAKSRMKSIKGLRANIVMKPKQLLRNH